MVCVFDKWTKKDEFNTWGERILNPSYCMIHQEENGDYSLELHQPIDSADDSYLFLKHYNILKVTSGQLFIIDYIQKRMVSNVPTLIIKAKHIFYYLNHKITFNIQTQGENGWSCWTVLEHLFNNAYIKYNDDQIEYQFEYSSDLGQWNHYSANGISIAKGIFDLCDIWGGYLYRDNFKLSIRAVMQGAKTGAFIAEHGWNVTDVTETIDWSGVYTEILADDNKGTQQFRESIVPKWGVSDFPFQRTGYVQLSYDDKSNLWNDARSIFNTRREPDVSYELNLMNLSDTTRASGWAGFEQIRVGDVGTVKSTILGFETQQRVVSTDFNELTQRNEKVKLQGFRHSSSLHPGRYDQFIYGNNAETRRIANLERKSNFFEYVD